MKQSTKTILLVIATINLALTLYFCLPAIPKKIKNEIRGTSYTFEGIIFDLPSYNYIVNEDLTNQINERNNQNRSKALLLMNEQNEKDFITLIRNNDDGFKFIKESIDYFKNPFQHRISERKVKKENNLQSSDSTLLISPTKEVVLQKNITKERLALYTVDVIIGNTSYTFIPSAVAGEEVVWEFIRTVSAN